MRRKKPRGMPKRPLSAYNIFFRTQRTIVQAKANKKKKAGSKGLGFEGLGKLIGKQWKELSKEERKKYEVLADKDNVRYRREMDAYNDKRKLLMEKERNSHVLPSFIGLEAASKHSPNFVLSESSRMNSGAFPSQTRLDRIDELAQNSNPRDSVENDASLPLPVIQPLNGSTGKFPLPEGMEIVLRDSTGQDRMYRVEYKCYRMSRAEAFRYIDSVSNEFRPAYGEAHAFSPQNRGVPEGCDELPTHTSPL